MVLTITEMMIMAMMMIYLPILRCTSVSWITSGMCTGVTLSLESFITT